MKTIKKTIIKVRLILTVSFSLFSGYQARTLELDSYGRTPLHLSALKCDVDEVVSLLNQGADYHRLDNQGYKASDTARSIGCSQIVNILKDREKRDYQECFDEHYIPGQAGKVNMLCRNK
ncbi:MAG: hypothetical protein GDA46_03890 [Bdellovibrionales bacterium]|nr:hypothetical protein [Bdellovibrionales bacterium]